MWCWQPRASAISKKSQSWRKIKWISYLKKSNVPVKSKPQHPFHRATPWAFECLQNLYSNSSFRGAKKPFKCPTIDQFQVIKKCLHSETLFKCQVCRQLYNTGRSLCSPSFAFYPSCHKAANLTFKILKTRYFGPHFGLRHDSITGTRSRKSRLKFSPHICGRQVPHPQGWQRRQMLGVWPVGCVESSIWLIDKFALVYRWIDVIHHIRLCRPPHAKRHRYNMDGQYFIPVSSRWRFYPVTYPVTRAFWTWMRGYAGNFARKYLYSGTSI